jgi:PAS domain S-box-containing protein
MHELVELRSLLETHERPFVVIGADRRIVAVNSAFEQAFDLPRELIEGAPCHRVLHGRERPCDESGEHCPLTQCLRELTPSSCLHTHRDARGRTRWMRVNMYPIRGADGTAYVGESLHEIAARDSRDEADELKDLRLVGRSPEFLAAMEQLEQAAQTDAPVLIVGETGTGKELAARFIHRQSARSRRPFVAVDCTVIAEALFESELFGHERGAFTGSVQSRPGLFEVAEDGTVFLDEIGEASPSAQAKLLRVLEAREYRRVGGNRTISTNARVICATNRDLWQRVEDGAFREDLYYRIACFRVRIPPLRERLQDVPLLADALLRRIGKAQKRVYRLDRRAVELLLAYDYPGNIRELRNVLQVAVANSASAHRGRVGADAVAIGLRMHDRLTDTPPPLPPQPVHGDGVRPASVVPWSPVAAGSRRGPRGTAPAEAPLRDLEAAYIEGQLRQCGGNRRRVADALGISERTLYRKLAKYGLSRG